MVSVTKLGGQQRRIIRLIGRDGLTWTQIQKATGLETSQLSRVLRHLVGAKVLTHTWDRKGRAVYKLPERKADVSKN
jgi:DNA-binding transcriptional regulator GbsR (MarR family)